MAASGGGATATWQPHRPSHADRSLPPSAAGRSVLAFLVAAGEGALQGTTAPPLLPTRSGVGERLHPFHRTRETSPPPYGVRTLRGSSAPEAPAGRSRSRP